MNREIRFRVWDKENKAFLLPEVSDGMLITLNGVVGHFSNIDDDDNGIIQNGKAYFPEEKFVTEMYELNQYTGLKDKNGKDAFEGDIIEFVSTEGKLYRKEIIWDKELCSICFGNFPYERLHESGYFQPSKIIFEIIGNIYENINLLNQKS